MANTTVTVNAGKKLQLANGMGTLTEKTAGQTADVPAHEATRLIRQGIAT